MSPPSPATGQAGLPRDARPSLPFRADPTVDTATIYRSLLSDPAEAERLVDRLLAGAAGPSSPGPGRGDLGRPAVRLRLLNSPAYSSKTFLDALLVRVRAERDDLFRALALARLALDHACHGLSANTHRGAVADCRILAAATVATVERRLYRLRPAGEALAEAERSIPGYTRNPEVAAALATEQALCHAAAGNDTGALDRLAQILALWVAVDDRHRGGIILLRQSEILRRAGHPREALLKAHQAAACLDLAHHPRFAYRLLEHLARAHIASAELDLAADYLDSALTIPHYALSQEEILHLQSLRTRTLALRGQVDRALSHASEVRRAWLARGYPHRAALSSVRLARDLALAGQVAALTELLGDTRIFFQPVDLPPGFRSLLDRLPDRPTMGQLKRLGRRFEILEARTPRPGPGR